MPDESVEIIDNLSKDAFQRLRISEAETLFDSKQIHDNLPLLFDDQEVSGTGTTSVHSVNRAESVLGVSLNTAGLRMRQSFRAFNYQPGKSQLIQMTGNLKLTGGGSGIEAGMGYIDDNNGIALVVIDGIPAIRLRSKVSGSVVDNDVSQLDWNIDKMDGYGPSPSLHTIDPTKGQNLAIWLQWLSLGSVTVSLIMEDDIHPINRFDHANEIIGAYMSTPNLPMRWWIENDGTGAASTMASICGTVISEGGHNPLGVPQVASTEGTHVDANVIGTLYAVIGMRIKAARNGVDMRLTDMSMISETNDDFEWVLLHNPTVAGTFTYSDKSNSNMQVAKGALANTVTNGHSIAGRFSKSNGQLVVKLDSALSLGKAIDGTPDEVVICVRPLSSNADIQASLGWLEF